MEAPSPRSFSPATAEEFAEYLTALRAIGLPFPILELLYSRDHRVGVRYLSFAMRAVGFRFFPHEGKPGAFFVPASFAASLKLRSTSSEDWKKVVDSLSALCDNIPSVTPNP